MKINILLLILLFTSTLAYPILAQSNNMFIKLQKFTIYDINRDFIYVEYSGEEDIIVLVVKSDPNLNIIKQSIGMGHGNIVIYITNASYKSGSCIIALSSSSPFLLNITLRMGDVPLQTQTISVPANITLQMEIPIDYGSYQQPIYTFTNVLYIPYFPIWILLPYMIVIPMFLITGYLDKNSLKIIRRRWSQLDTFALMIRYSFYAFLIIFIIVTIEIIVEYILIRLNIYLTNLHIGDWLISCALLSLFTIIYGIGKWRGLFENVDGEE
jgi:hypothetical protein